MSMPNSVDEIDIGMVAEGLAELPAAEYDFWMSTRIDQNRTNNLTEKGYGYWLDNCGEEVDGDPYYFCKRCLQPECNKRKYYKKLSKNIERKRL